MMGDFRTQKSAAHRGYDRLPYRGINKTDDILGDLRFAWEFKDHARRRHTLCPAQARDILPAVFGPARTAQQFIVIRFNNQALRLQFVKGRLANAQRLARLFCRKQFRQILGGRFAGNNRYIAHQHFSFLGIVCYGNYSTLIY